MERVDDRCTKVSTTEYETMTSIRKRQRGDHKMRSQMIGLKKGGMEEGSKQEGTSKSKGGGGLRRNN